GCGRRCSKRSARCFPTTCRKTAGSLLPPPPGSSRRPSPRGAPRPHRAGLRFSSASLTGSPGEDPEASALHRAGREAAADELDPRPHPDQPPAGADRHGPDPPRTVIGHLELEARGAHAELNRGGRARPVGESVLDDPSPSTSHRRSRPSLACRWKPADLLRRPMAETLPKEGISARLAEIRGQLKLLSDYL